MILKYDGDNPALKAGLWYIVSSIIVKMVSVITTPVFTRILTPDEYGIVATFSSWYSLLLVIFSLNLSVSIGRAKLDYPDKLDEYIGSIQVLSLVVSLCISFILLMFINPVSDFFELNVSGTIILLLYLIASPTVTYWQCLYRYKYKYKQNIAIALFVAISTVVISLILIFLVDTDKALLRMIGITLPIIGLSLYFWLKTIYQRNCIFNIKYWKYGLAIAVPMILHAISMNILGQSDRILISKFSGKTYVAFYSLVRNYAILIFVITDAINQAWLPWFHDNYYLGNQNEIRKNSKLLVLFTYYVGLAAIAFGPEAIIFLGGQQYIEAVNCIPPMVLGVICQCTYSHYINIEIHLKKTKYAPIGTIIAALLNIVLNFIFVPTYGYIAAAYTTFVSYLVLLFVHFIITNKVLKASLYDNLFIFISLFITTILSYLLTLTYNNIFIRYLCIIIGAVSFLYVFRHFIKSIVSKYMQKIWG